MNFKRGLNLILLSGWVLLASGCTQPAASPTASAPAADPPLPTATAGPTATPDIAVLATRVAVTAYDTVASADGRAELLFPEGSLPAGVDAADISLTLLGAAEAPLLFDEAPPLAAYQLEPDGLRLAGPALLRFSLDVAEAGGVPLVLMRSGKQIELLDAGTIRIDPDGETMAVSVAVTHFSSVSIGWGFFNATVSDPGEQGVDVPFSVKAAVERAKAQVEIRARTEDDDALVMTLDVIEWRLQGSWYASAPLTPERVLNAPPFTLASLSSFSLTQQFTCLEPSDLVRVEYSGFVQYRVEFQDILQFKDSRFEVETQPFKCRRNRPPVITAFRAFFEPALGRTDYRVTASDPDGDSLTYQWLNSNGCGSFAFSLEKAIWEHAHPPCPKEQFHPAFITVTVSDGLGGQAIYTYTGGSLSGEIKVTPTPTPTPSPPPVRSP
jgi:hypothetical protein